MHTSRCILLKNLYNPLLCCFNKGAESHETGEALEVASVMENAFPGGTSFLDGNISCEGIRLFSSTSLHDKYRSNSYSRVTKLGFC